MARPDYNRSAMRFASLPGEDGRFTPIMALVNKKQVSIADGTVFPEQYADESRLRYGLFDPAAGGRDSISAEGTEGMLFYAAAVRAGGVLDYQPAAGGDFIKEGIKPYLWPKWDGHVIIALFHYR